MAADKNKPTTDEIDVIADVSAGRHPSPSEKEWAEKSLAPSLEKSPERPIGAATGTNRAIVAVTVCRTRTTTMATIQVGMTCFSRTDAAQAARSLSPIARQRRA